MKEKMNSYLPSFKSPSEVLRRIHGYFQTCQGSPLLGDDGQEVLDRQGKPLLTGGEPPTITGLALFLGFVSREEMLGFKGSPPMERAITRGISMVEKYTVTRLFDKEGLSGAKFILSCSFKGWSEGGTTPEFSEDDPLTKSIEEAAKNGFIS